MLLEIILLFFCGLTLISGQSTNANCSGDFEWARNSKDQSPCQVAAILGSACVNSQFQVPAIKPGECYSAPENVQANLCECNAVYYSLLSACCKCQNGDPISFTKWTTHCEEPVLKNQEYPAAKIPNSTIIPAWAFFELKDGKWDINAAAMNATNGTWVPPKENTLSTPEIVGISIGGTIAAVLVIIALVLLVRYCVAGKNDDDKSTRSSVRYNKIEGPPRKPGFFAAASRVVSYRPGLNFDLVKNRTGDLVELNRTRDPSPTPRPSVWGSVSSLVPRSRAPSETQFSSHPSQISQKESMHQPSQSSISSIFTRPKEVRSARPQPEFDLHDVMGAPPPLPRSTNQQRPPLLE